MSVTFYTTNHFWHHYQELRQGGNVVWDGSGRHPAAKTGCPFGYAFLPLLFSPVFLRGGRLTGSAPA